MSASHEPHFCTLYEGITALTALIIGGGTGIKVGSSSEEEEEVMANSDDYRGRPRLQRERESERARELETPSHAPKKPLHLLRITIENHVAAAATAARERSCDPDKKYGLVQCLAGCPRPR